MYVLGDIVKEFIDNKGGMKNSWTIVLLCIAIVAVSVRLMVADNSSPDNADSAENEMLECIMTRASVRKYKPDPVNDSIMTAL